MITQMKVPEVGESIQEVEIAHWLKQEGQSVEKDEEVVEVDSEKASLQIPSPAAGRIVKILKHDGDKAQVGEVIAEIDDAAPRDEGQAANPRPAVERNPSEPKQEETKPASNPEATAGTSSSRAQSERKLIATRHEPKKPALRPAASARGEEIVPMSMIRRRIAARLVEAQRNAALLTTFNEIDMSAVMELRTSLRETFQERYGVKLGFMSFFVKAVIEGLKRFPEVNAEIRGDDIVFHNYFDIGIAIGGGKGLVVPVLRDADQLGFGEVELAIDDFAKRAANKKLMPEELTGGTFTISNGGVYGSLLSTPIINPPQSGVLGMHTIQERPVARNGAVVIRPMMYVALTYDHRIVDGREAVGFLRRVKDLVEQPSRILLEV